MAESQLSLKACIFSLCVSIEELESVIQTMTIHDSSDKLKKIALRERMVLLCSYGIQTQRTSSSWWVPSAQQSFVRLKREGESCVSCSSIEQIYLAVSVTTCAVLTLLDF